MGQWVVAYLFLRGSMAETMPFTGKYFHNPVITRLFGKMFSRYTGLSQVG